MHEENLSSQTGLVRANNNYTGSFYSRTSPIVPPEAQCLELNRGEELGKEEGASVNSVLSPGKKGVSCWIITTTKKGVTS